MKNSIRLCQGPIWPGANGRIIKALAFTDHSYNSLPKEIKEYARTLVQDNKEIPYVAHTKEYVEEVLRRTFGAYLESNPTLFPNTPQQDYRIFRRIQLYYTKAPNGNWYVTARVEPE